MKFQVKLGKPQNTRAFFFLLLQPFLAVYAVLQHLFLQDFLSLCLGGRHGFKVLILSDTKQEWPFSTVLSFGVPSTLHILEGECS